MFRASAIDAPPMRLPLLAALLLSLIALTGCLPRGNAGKPVPTLLVPAPQPPASGDRRLVVVLPGRADDLAALRDSGMAQAIQGVWPDADVVLAELTIAYYMQGDAAQLLHRDVIAPARARGYRQIWLTGASMGGLGTLMYEQAYPGTLDGLVLLAPYIGDAPIHREIREAGGVAGWDPGPAQARSRVTWQRDLWRHLKTWHDDPRTAQRVWLAYGDDDRLRKALPTLTPLLPADQVRVFPGGHDWPVWTAGVAWALRSAEGKKTAPK